MTYRMYGLVAASLSAVALLLAANETFAASRAATRAGFHSTRPIFRPSVAASLRHHRSRNLAIVWPGDFFYGPSNGEALANVTQPASGDIHQTYTYDVPWDWAHRYPPERPYVVSCPAETVTVPGRDGSEQTVNIMRCY